MQHLAEDLLTLGRSENGRLQLMVAPVYLTVVASEVVRRVGALAQNRGQTLEFRGDGLPHIVDADPDRIQ